MELILIIIWLLCGGIASSIIESKGGSGCLGFLLGVLLGPLGVLFALVLPKDEKGIEKKALISGKMKACPYCAEIIKKEAIVCRHCGNELVDK